jgi:C4-type Zn-finger protein
MVIDLQKTIKENKKLKERLSKKSSKEKKVSKFLKKQLSAKRIIKPSQVTVRIPDYKAPSVLGDENRFFKGQLNKEKKEMFFS